MSSSSSSTALSLDHLPPSEQLCYVQCNICDTVLAVFTFTFSLLILARVFLFLHLINKQALLLYVIFSYILFNVLVYLLIFFRWVFLAAACSRLWLWDAAIAPTFCRLMLTCVVCCFLQQTSFITWLTLSTLHLITIFWYVLTGFVSYYLFFAFGLHIWYG